MLKEIGELAQELIPPHDGDPEKIYRWRVFLAGTVIAMAAGLGTHIALACGFIPSLFSGFASASDVASLASQQQQMRVESVGDTLYNLKKDQCIAQNSGNLQAAQGQDQRIREKRDLYRILTRGREFDLPSCDLFVSR
jgi:hypothetical protein